MLTILDSINRHSTVKRHIKRIVCIVLAISLSIPVVSFAANEDVSYTYYADEAKYEGLNSTIADTSSLYDTSHGRVHLQPLRQSQIIFEVNVAEAGEYTLDVVYTCGSNTNRKLGYSVNGGNPTYSGFLTGTGTWSKTNNVTATVSLNAGNNTIKVVSPEDYNKTVDNVKVGTPGIFGIKVSNTEKNVSITKYADEAQYAGLNGTTVNGTAYESHGYINLAPKNPLEPQGKIVFTADVEIAGQYELDIVYSGKSSTRKLGYSINGGTAVYSEALEATQYWTAATAKSYKVNATLNKGKNTITVLSPEDYDGKTISTPDIWAIKLKSIPVTEGTLYADEAQYEGLNSTIADTSSLYDTSHGRVHLQPLRQSQIIFEVNVAEAGEYTLDVVYTCGSNTNRKLGYSVNGGNPTYSGFLTGTGTWSKTNNVTATVTLNAGNNIVKVISPEDYNKTDDNVKVGTPGIFGIKVSNAEKNVSITKYADEAQYAGLNNSAVNGTAYESHGYINLAPQSPLEPQGKIIFVANVAEAGDYTLGIVYSGKGTTRKLGYSINGENAVYTDALEATSTWASGNAKTYEVTVSLNKGANTITVLSPEDYDGSTIATPDIWAVKFSPAPEIEPIPIPPEATSGTLYADEAQYEGLKSTEAKRDTLYDETHGSISLAPLSSSGKIVFTANIAEAGEYTLSIVYSGKGTTRKLGYSINGGTVVYSNALAATKYWTAETANIYEVNVNLNEGVNTIEIVSPSDFDDSTVAAPDIWAIKFAPAPEIEPTPIPPEATSGTLYADEAQYEGLKSTEAKKDTLYDETHGSISLAPSSTSGKIVFTANIAEAGEYTLSIVYSGKGTTRKLGYSINGGIAVYSNALAATKYWTAETANIYEVNVTLNEGVNIIEIVSPSDFNGSTVAAPDIWAIKFAPAPEIEPTPIPPEATSGTLYADEAKYEGIKSTEAKKDTLYDGTHGSISLAPSSSSGKIVFTANIAEAGEYTLSIVYSGKGITRKLGYSINGGTAVYSNALVATKYWTAETANAYEVNVNLKKGINTIEVLSPKDFNGSTVAAPDIWAVKFELNKQVEPLPTPSAATSGTVYADEAQYKNLDNTEAKKTTLYDETHGSVSLAPQNKGDGYKSGQMIFTINVAKSDKYRIYIVYSGRNPVRKMGYAINDGDVTYVTLEETATWKAENAKQYSIIVDLKKGINKITLFSPADYEPKVVQAPDIWAVKYLPDSMAGNNRGKTERDVIVGTSTKSTSDDAVRLYAGEAERKNLTFDGEVTINGLLDNAYGYVSPASKTDQGQIIFTVDVEEAGTYNLDIIYTCKRGSTRKLGYSVNNSEVLYMTVGEYTKTWSVTQIKYMNLRVPLNKGENTFTIWSPDDQSAAPNVYAIQYSFETSNKINVSEGLKEVLPEGYFAEYADKAKYSNLSDEEANYDTRYEGHGRMHLTPTKNENGSYKQGAITFTVDVKESGIYEIDVIYSGRGITRKLEYSVNGKAKVSTELSASGSWGAEKAKAYTFEAELKAGKNTIVIYSPQDYTAGKIQAPDIWAIKGNIKK